MKIRDIARIFSIAGADYNAHAVYEFLSAINADITCDTDREIDFNLPSGICGNFMFEKEGNYVLLYNKSMDRTYLISNGELCIYSSYNGFLMRAYNVSL